MRRDPAEALLALYARLLADHGHLGWWPGRTRFEIVVGAILTQNTSWRNVESALDELRARGWLCPGEMMAVPEADLARAIRPSGYFRQKARKLRALLAWLYTRHRGSFARAARVPTDTLRAQLLSIWGIGPESADSILLYAFGRRVFVVDAYAHRLLVRHGLHPGGGYEEVRAFLESNLPRRVELYNDFHAQIVWVGHRFCRARPACDACPLASLLPKGGPLPDVISRAAPIRRARPAERRER